MCSQQLTVQLNMTNLIKVPKLDVLSSKMKEICSSPCSVISASQAKVYPGTKVNDMSSIPIYTSSSGIVNI
ncbi:hypothetical protein DICVIV_14217, partial [Dictyocaulus viviparus]